MPSPSSLTDDELQALSQSRLRAHQWVIEADEQRISDQRAQLERFRSGGQEPCEPLITAADARLAARNALSTYARLRDAKYIRARLRKYRRLKYEYELEHPPFTDPEFIELPPHPQPHIVWRRNTTEGWRTDEDVPASQLTTADDEISPPSYPKPLPKVNDDPDAPSAAWGERGGTWGEGSGWGGAGWG
ncbi:hypothetical protein R3P38DRAFT_3173037 [Favolaschia claudopus]|uniref:Uncharacterized protein n=1 Tax=Favolaschia claudopus TaxID=2862362 RepID=A0AAW0DMY2_9AGAR